MSEVTATETEQRPGEAGDAEAHPVDFSQPTRFTADLRQRIARELAPFRDSVSTRLSVELGAPVELHHKGETQLTWSAAHAALPQDSLRVALKVKSTGKHMLMVLDQPLAMRTLNCLVGGSAADAPASRRLSEIDYALIRRLLNSVVYQLSGAWQELAGQELVLEELEIGGDPHASVPGGEPTLTVVMECSIDGLAADLSVLIPWSSAESLARYGHGSSQTEADPTAARALQQGLAGAKMLVRAEIGARTLAVERVLGIAPGGVLRLEAKAEHGVRLISEGVVLARGLPGRSGVHRAVKLTTPVQPHTDPSARPLPALQSHNHTGSAEQAAALLERLSHLRHIDLRVWAELGRTHLSLGRALSMPQGALVELDEGAEDPVGIYVNGVRLASGALAVTAHGDWAVQVATLG